MTVSSETRDCQLQAELGTKHKQDNEANNETIRKYLIKIFVDIVT